MRFLKLQFELDYKQFSQSCRYAFKRNQNADRLQAIQVSRVKLFCKMVSFTQKSKSSKFNSYDYFMLKMRVK